MRKTAQNEKAIAAYRSSYCKIPTISINSPKCIKPKENKLGSQMSMSIIMDKRPEMLFRGLLMEAKKMVARELANDAYDQMVDNLCDTLEEKVYETKNRDRNMGYNRNLAIRIITIMARKGVFKQEYNISAICRNLFTGNDSIRKTMENITIGENDANIVEAIDQMMQETGATVAKHTEHLLKELCKYANRHYAGAYEEFCAYILAPATGIVSYLNSSNRGTSGVTYRNRFLGLVKFMMDTNIINNTTRKEIGMSLFGNARAFERAKELPKACHNELHATWKQKTGQE